MDISYNWDGTLLLSGFYVAARTLSEKWKKMNPALPPWTWIPFPRPPWLASCEVDGYLSLENVCYIRSCEEDRDEGSCTVKEGSSYLGKEEPDDNATLVRSYDEEIHYYDFHIVYSTSYRVPVLYFRGYCCDGQTLALEDIEKDLPSNSLKILRESKWTFITQEEHPYLNRPWYTLHPCGTSDWMKLLFLGDASLTKDGGAIQQYLVSWLSVVGQVVGLRIPLEMLNNSRQLYPETSSSVVGGLFDETYKGIVSSRQFLG